METNLLLVIKQYVSFCKKFLLVALMILITCAVSNSNETNVCDRLSECISLIAETKNTGRGISNEEQELAKLVQQYEREAIPGVLAYFKHDNRNVRDLAGYIINSINGLTTDDLPALIDAVENDVGWIEPAIASIGTESAISCYLIDRLKIENETANQLGFAMQKLGAKVVPYFIADLKCTTNCDEDYFYWMNRVFISIKDEAADALPELLAIINNENYAYSSRKYAILNLGAIGKASFETVPYLNALAAADPDQFEEVVESALFLMQHPQSAMYIAKALAETENSFDKRIKLRDLAEFRHEAIAKGPQVEKVVLEDDWDARVAAARTLGYIGYKEAIPTLISALNEEGDWQLVYVSVISLGRLEATEAISALQKVASEHWYTPVREAAEFAIQVIIGKKDYVSHWHPKNFPFEYFDYEQVGRDLATCQRVALDKKSHDTNIKLYASSNPDEIKNHSYTVSYEDEVWDENKNEYIKTGEFKQDQVIPSVALKVDEHWMLGTNRGEWGGELRYVIDKDNHYTVVNDNVQNLFKTRNGFLALTGLAHLTMDRGTIYQLSKSEEGLWIANKYLTLPGSPYAAWKLEDDSILVNTTGGSINLTTEGKLKMATCSD